MYHASKQISGLCERIRDAQNTSANDGVTYVDDSLKVICFRCVVHSPHFQAQQPSVAMDSCHKM
jgi:hypothetical protein